jgi:flagellar hook protein FlgE
MAASWDGTAKNPLSAYSYNENIQFYDSGGALRNASIYYDLAQTNGGQTVLEYVVALAPDDDGSSLAGTKAAGLLMAGTVNFSSKGELQNITAFTPPASGDPADLAAWLPAPLANGSPAFTVTPSGGSSQTIALNMGLNLSGATAYASAADVAASPAGLYAADTAATRATTASTAYGTTTGTTALTMDGYGAGVLKSLDIASDGTITAQYSNGQSHAVYRIPLYRFTSQDGLENAGGNHYRATTASGTAQEGVAGTENFGVIREYSLEQSNVDYAREFSNMIITQRGFQMNSKIITTCDLLLQKALEIKR